jgi:hypothetical protein
MPEYAGYTGQKSIDWLSLAKGIKGDIDQGLKAREERKAADEKLFTDASKNLNSWESTQDKSFNTVVLGGLDQARNKALEWNKDLKSGAISRNEYQRRMSNLNESFDSLTTATKNFDQYVTSINDRQQKGLSSSFEMFSALINSDLQNVGQKSLNIGDEGDFFMVSDTDGTVQNVRNYTNMNNIVDNKIDVAGSVDNIVSKWDPVVLQELKAGGVVVSSEDPRLNDPAYKAAKENLIGSLVDPKNARGVVSVLLDNSNLEYEMYYTKDQRNDLINKAIAKEESIKGKAMSADEQRAFAEKYDKENLIQVVQDNSGNYQPVINDKMIEDARRVVGDQIEIQLGWKKEADRGFTPQREPSTRAEDKEEATEQKRANEYSRGYVATMDAFGIDPNTNKRIKGKADFSGLDNRYQYIRTSKGVQIWKSGSFDENGKENKKKSVYVGLATTPKGLAEYAVYGKSTAEAETNYEKGRTQYRGAKGIGGNTSGNKPAAQGAGDDIFGNP